MLVEVQAKVSDEFYTYHMPARYIKGNLRADPDMLRRRAVHGLRPPHVAWVVGVGRGVCAVRP